MSKEEFMKIQTYVLKVNIHCDGCKNKVKKILQKIDGVLKTNVDSELGKVTVFGNVDPNILIKKLAKSGKHAELWGAQKANKQNQNNVANQFKNIQLDNGKGANNNNKGQKAGNNNNNQQPKGGGQPNPQQLQQQLQQMKGQPNPQQLQPHLQQMKGFQDLKLPPQFKDMKMPNIKDLNPNQRAVKFNVPDEDDLSDFDDDYYDDDDLYDEYDNELDELHSQPNKSNPIVPNGPQGLPPGVMMMMMNAQKGAQNGGQNGGQNGKKSGGGGSAPFEVNMANEGKNGNGGKKGGGGGNNGGNNQNQGGKAGKNGGGMPHDGKIGNNGGGVGGKNGNNGGGWGGANLNMNANGGNKGNNGGGGGGGGMGDMGYQFPNITFAGHPGMAAAAANANLGPMGNIPMGQMGNIPMRQMGNMSAVQGLPAAAMTSGAGGGAGYFQGAGPDLMPGNPYHQQQQQPYMATAMVNQQRTMGSERYQPVMYARPPAAVNYMPQPPYPYPYPPPYAAPPQDPAYTHFFSDENTSSCNVM